MAKTLPGAWELITESWNAFIKTWDTTVRVSTWLILVGALQAVGGFYEKGVYGPSGLLSPIFFVAAAIVSIYISIALYRLVLGLERGEKMSTKISINELTPLFLPLVLIGILQGLVVLGATLLLIIPGIYVGVRLSFSQMSLFDKNLHGRAAMAESWAITKGRFWQVFGRQLAGGLTFGAFIVLIAILAITIVTLIAGAGKMNNLFSDSSNTAMDGAVSSLISSIVQAAILPLIVIFQVKLYNAFNKTKA
jgi:hypothetical protein